LGIILETIVDLQIAKSDTRSDSSLLGLFNSQKTKSQKTKHTLTL
jgi:hypothetical protein